MTCNTKGTGACTPCNLHLVRSHRCCTRSTSHTTVTRQCRIAPVQTLTLDSFESQLREHSSHQWCSSQTDDPPEIANHWGYTSSASPETHTVNQICTASPAALPRAMKRHHLRHKRRPRPDSQQPGASGVQVDLRCSFFHLKTLACDHTGRNIGGV
jgi:hypothetical protein